jgi:peptide/nickel transport system substrate-binding protein
MRLLFISLVVALSACARAPESPTPASAEQRSTPVEPNRTLIFIGGRSPENLSSKPVRDTAGAGNPRGTQRAFNAGLALNDERELPRAYLADALPEVNTETWRVLPDGRMETTYRLRPNLTWHDGMPLTAADFVFAWRVYATADIGNPTSPPLNFMEEVVAVDDRTILFRWNQPYADAGDLQAREFPPLPRHLLETPFTSSPADAFVALPFWLADYVGAGPFRVTRFEMGAFIEGAAFNAHALGRPKIDSIRFTYYTDANTVLANLLADNGHVATDSSFDLQQAIVLDREWSAKGSVLRNPVGVRHANINVRPDVVTPRALLDVRARRALAYSWDRLSLADSLTEGQGTTADALVLSQVDYFPDVERVITKYPYDPRRAEQLLNEIGFTKGADGFFASSAERFNPEIAVAQGGRNDTEVQIAVDGLRRVGVDSTVRIIPRPQVTEPYIFANFSSVLIGSANRAFVPPIERFRASEIARPDTRGRGSNYAGYQSAEMERLINGYETALQRSERTQYVAQMMKVLTEDLPIIPLYYNLEFLAHVSNLAGPQVSVSTDAATWNIHEWRWTS